MLPFARSGRLSVSPCNSARLTAFPSKFHAASNPIFSFYCKGEYCYKSPIYGEACRRVGVCKATSTPFETPPAHFSRVETQIPKFGIVLVVVLVLGAFGFHDSKETDGTNLFC